jgi:sigma-B regulation protein RsbU (phosphoserine phosphatase)
MIASGIHAAIRLMANNGFSLAGLADRINGYLVNATADNRFATFAMVRLDPDGRLVGLNAGHCPILIRRVDGTIEEITSSGLPLGMMSIASYSERETRLDPGDLLLLYTDGLTEAEDPDEEEFGVERISALVAGLEHPSAEAACKGLLDAVHDHTCGQPLYDDATLLVVERLKE